MEVGSSSSHVEDQPWVEKYRPKVLTDVQGHNNNVKTLMKQMQLGILPHMLFHGPPGTGKTSTITAIANELYGNSRQVYVLELNASDDRGLEVVRQQIKTFCSTQSISFGSISSQSQNARFNGGVPKYKIVVLDECDAMSKDAQNALRRVIENYALNCRFCLIGNHLNKIIPALQSRCMCLRFGPLPPDSMIDRIKDICEIEGVRYDEGGLQAVVTLAGGDMRSAVNITQQVASRMQIDEDSVYRSCGRPLPREINEVFHLLLNKPQKDVIQHLSELLQRTGSSLSVVVDEILPLVLGMETKGNSAIIFLLQWLSEIASMLGKMSDEVAGLNMLVAVFYKARDMIAQDL